MAVLLLPLAGSRHCWSFTIKAILSSPIPVTDCWWCSEVTWVRSDHVYLCMEYRLGTKPRMPSEEEMRWNAIHWDETPHLFLFCFVLSCSVLTTVLVEFFSCLRLSSRPAYMSSRLSFILPHLFSLQRILSTLCSSLCHSTSLRLLASLPLRLIPYISIPLPLFSFLYFFRHYSPCSM